MKQNTRSQLALGLLSIALLVTGCAQVGYFSKMKTFQGTDSMVLDAPRADILDVIKAVGKSMNYDVSTLDPNAGHITLSYGSGVVEILGIGKMNHSNLQITTQDGGKKLNIAVYVSGNFGTGGQDAATKLMTDFKIKLAERLAVKG